MSDRRIRGGRAFALAVALSVAGPICHASTLVPCAPGTGFDYGPSPHVVCGGAQGHGGGVGVEFGASPDPFASFLSGVGGSMGVAGAGIGGLAASAAGSGTFGEVHLFAFADNGDFTTIDPNRTGGAFAQAEIVFVDGGIVDGPIGAPVDLRFTISMEGAFTGAGEGDFTFNVFDRITFLGSRSAFLYSGSPSFSNTWDLTVHGGDTLFFSMDMLAQANTTNDGALVLRSTADVSHTGRVFLDVLTPGADFVSNSGTNYATSAAAAAPEPAPWTVLLIVAGGAVAWKRSRQIIIHSFRR